MVSSFGKSFHVTGWKVGYLVAPEYLMKEIKKVHQFLVFSVNSLCQVAISEYLWFRLTASEYVSRERDYFRKFRNKSSSTLCPKVLIFWLYAAISTENDVAFCKRLITEYGVAASHFNFYENGKDHHLIRFVLQRQRYSGRSGKTTMQNLIP
jgi:methionine aminotransferase